MTTPPKPDSTIGMTVWVDGFTPDRPDPTTATGRGYDAFGRRITFVGNRRNLTFLALGYHASGEFQSCVVEPSAIVSIEPADSMETADPGAEADA